MGSKKVLGVLLALALPLALPATASADVAPAGGDDQHFSDSQGGWTAATAYDGLCVPAVTCTTVTNDHVASGGTGGPSDGYIRSEFGVAITTFAGTTTATWTSPTFVYRGNGGKNPAAAELDLSIRPQVSALLGVDLTNQSSYRVDLVDITSDTAVSAVPPTPLLGDAEWTAVPTASINPALLTLGHSYQIRIATSYSSVLALTATGEVGYDDVVLTTYGVGTDRLGGDGTDGVNGGSGITTVKQLRTLSKNVVLPKSARLAKNKVRVKVRCPKKAAPLACKVKVRGLAKGKKSKAATKAKAVSIKAGKKKVVKLKVKPRYRAKYRDARKVTLKSRVKVGDAKVVVTKRVNLRR